MHKQIIWSLMVSLVILALVFTGCGQSNTSVGNSVTPAQTGGNVSPPSSTPTGTTSAGVTPVSPSSTSSQSQTGGSPPSGTPPAGTPPGGFQGGTPPDGTPPGAFQGGNPPSGFQGGAPPGGSGSPSVTGTAVYSQSGQTVTQSNQTITAAEQNQSAVRITDSGVYNLSDSTISTSGDTSSMDDSSFYGLNAAVLAESGSHITLSRVKITTTGSGANGVFATGEGSTIDLTDVTIECTNTGAHGVDATLGGILNLTNVDITTAGNGASAAIATDRGSGTINVTGGTVVTTGTKSPPIYSTGAITVTGSNMKATSSEAVVIEGKNSVTLNDVTISGGKNWGVIIYQSMSGDAEEGTGNFTMNGGSLTAAEGPLFYCTNTSAVIRLVGAVLNSPSGILLKASAGDWGNSGSNGAAVDFTADNQVLNGSVICDDISTLALTLKNGTVYTGVINSEKTAKSVSLNLDAGSIWEVQGNSYLTSLTDADSSLSNIHSNGYTVYYDASDSASSWLNGQTYDLAGGGKLTPKA